MAGTQSGAHKAVEARPTAHFSEMGKVGGKSTTDKGFKVLGKSAASNAGKAGAKVRWENYRKRMDSLSLGPVAPVDPVDPKDQLQ